MKMSRRRRQTGSEESSGNWLTTYADLITLLFTFFVLLYTFSSIDAERFKEIAISLQMALTGQSGPTMFDEYPDGPIGPIIPSQDLPPEDQDNARFKETQDGIAILNEEIKRVYGIVQSFVEEEDLEAEVRLRMDRRGVIIDINESILFDPGMADLKDESKLLLDKLTKLISAFDNNIIIEGHTDTVPISRSKYPTNWELSAARATTVLRYFAEEKNVAPERLSAAGYGEYRPVVPNDTAENKAQNRRVNILIEVSLEGGDAVETSS